MAIQLQKLNFADKHLIIEVMSIPSFIYSCQDPTLWLLFFGVILAGSSTSVIGCFSLLQKKGLAADAIAHALLPGICLSFIVTHQKAPYILTLGALASGGLALFLLHIIPVYTKIKRENSIAIILAIFLGLGLVLLSYIQHSGSESQAGLQHFLLGSVASLMQRDVWFFALLDLALFALLILLFREWQLLSFDADFAAAIGRPVKRLRIIFHFLTLLAIVMGVQTVGIVLMSAILLGPAAAARFWTNRLSKMIKIAAIFSCFANVAGVWFSFFLALPTGPCIVVFLNIITFFSFIIAPRRGWFARIYRQRQYQKRIWEENILKLLYQLGSKNNNYTQSYTIDMLFEARPLDKKKMRLHLQRLTKHGFVIRENYEERWALTPKGLSKGGHVRRLHVLWEAYLQHCMGMQKDKVHNDAEAMEHLISPTIEKNLTSLVGDKVSKEPVD